MLTQDGVVNGVRLGTEVRVESRRTQRKNGSRNDSKDVKGVFMERLPKRTLYEADAVLYFLLLPVKS